MKNFKTFFLLVSLLTILVGCESDDEKYSGTPVGNQTIETLEGTIATPTTVALLNQLIPFHVTLPRAFNDTVNVEVSTINLSGGRTRTTVMFQPGQTEADDEVPCSGGVLYDTSVNLSITGIALQTPDPGKHFLMKSNVIQIRTGNTAVPPSDNSRLSVRFAWPDPASTLNNIRLTVTRPVGTSTPTLVASEGGRTFSILSSLVSPALNSATNFSSQTGEYLFKINAVGLVSSPVNLPYRFIVRFPDGKSQLFEGVYNDLTTSSPQKTVLKVTKNVDLATSKVTYVVVPVQE